MAHKRQSALISKYITPQKKSIKSEKKPFCPKNTILEGSAEFSGLNMKKITPKVFRFDFDYLKETETREREQLESVSFLNSGKEEELLQISTKNELMDDINLSLGDEDVGEISAIPKKGTLPERSDTFSGLSPEEIWDIIEKHKLSLMLKESLATKTKKEQAFLADSFRRVNSKPPRQRRKKEVNEFFVKYIKGLMNKAPPRVLPSVIQTSFFPVKK